MYASFAYYSPLLKTNDPLIWLTHVCHTPCHRQGTKLMSVTFRTKIFGMMNGGLPMCSTPSPCRTGDPAAAIRSLPVSMTVTPWCGMGRCQNKLGTCVIKPQNYNNLYARLLSACGCFLHENKGLVLTSETLAYLWWLLLCWGRCRLIPSATPLTWPWCRTTRMGAAARATVAPTRATAAAGLLGRVTGRFPVAWWCGKGTPLTPGRDTEPRMWIRPSRRCGHLSPRNRWTGNSPKSRRCAWRPATSHTWPTCWLSGTGGRTASRVSVLSTRSWKGVERASSPEQSAHFASVTNEKG